MYMCEECNKRQQEWENSLGIPSILFICMHQPERLSEKTVKDGSDSLNLRENVRGKAEELSR